jgi:hypothetical protein
VRPARWILVLLILEALVAGLVGRSLRTEHPVTNYAPRIYVADWMNHRVVRMDDMRGRDWTSLGQGQFRFPVGVCVDAAGRLYVSEQDRRITRIDDVNVARWTTYTPPAAPDSKPNKYTGS